jgi:hypothetical protein
MNPTVTNKALRAITMTNFQKALTGMNMITLGRRSDEGCSLVNIGQL